MPRGSPSVESKSLLTKVSPSRPDASGRGEIIESQAAHGLARFGHRHVLRHFVQQHREIEIDDRRYALHRQLFSQLDEPHRRLMLAAGEDFLDAPLADAEDEVVALKTANNGHVHIGMRDAIPRVTGDPHFIDVRQIIVEGHRHGGRSRRTAASDRPAAGGLRPLAKLPHYGAEFVGVASRPPQSLPPPRTSVTKPALSVLSFVTKTAPGRMRRRSGRSPFRSAAARGVATFRDLRAPWGAHGAAVAGSATPGSKPLPRANSGNTVSPDVEGRQGRERSLDLRLGQQLLGLIRALRRRPAQCRPNWRRRDIFPARRATAGSSSAGGMPSGTVHPPPNAVRKRKEKNLVVKVSIFASKMDSAHSVCAEHRHTGVCRYVTCATPLRPYRATRNRL